MKNAKPKREQPVGQTWVIQFEPFGTPWFAAAGIPGSPFSDRRDEASVFDSRDNREAKLGFRKALAKRIGLDASTMRIVEVPA